MWKYILSTKLFTDDTIDYLSNHMCVSFLHCEESPTPFDTPFFQNKSLRKDALWEGRMVFHLLEKRGFSPLPWTRD
jgi:hypothetical protein